VSFPAMLRRLCTACCLVAALLLCACVNLRDHDTPTGAVARDYWQGRLAVRTRPGVAGTPESRQDFSAAFELQGSPEQGELTFFTPLGSAAARIRWTATEAELQSQGQTRRFGDLQHLFSQTTGATLPIDALFQWLRGQAHDTAGWQVDVSHHAEGKISAVQETPETVTELRLLLDPLPAQ